MQEQKEAPKEQKDVPFCCRGCVRFDRFGKNCWYYWELKKHCTMWTPTWDESMAQ